MSTSLSRQAFANSTIHDSARRLAPLHRALAAATHAETIAAAIVLTDAQYFTAKRRAIRAALVADGIAAEMEALVDALLPP